MEHKPPRNFRNAWRVGAAATAAVTIAVAMTGCSTSGGSTSGMDGSTVKMYTWIGNSADSAQWSAYTTEGHKVNSAVKVSFTGPPIGDYYTKLPTVLKGSTAPCIVTLQNGQLPPYVSALESLNSYAKAAGVKLSDYNTAMIEQLSSGGKAYALPYDAEPTVIFYNKKLFKEAGVPDPSLSWTTKDFVAAAKATTQDGHYGFAIGQGVYPISYWMTANNEGNYVKNGKANLLTPAFEKRFQFEVDLATKDKAAAPLQAAASGTFPDIDAFGNSQAAMLMNGTYDLSNEQSKIRKANLGVATLPSDNGNPYASVAGTGFAMTKTCSNKKAAFAAIEAMTSEKAQRSIAVSRNQVPARPDSISAWQQAAGPQAVAVLKKLTSRTTVPAVPTDINQVQTLFTQYETDAFSDKSSVKQVLQQVQSGLGQ